ncbi:hypothetical protein L6452_10741 [Arctium lappa]|uniref:Uncharacterized protein n=1 Tax=Arctium lappa TaxID=4217 RepID=A0ACB9DMQ0_ARCLA|nr:hypothetical protein L6452_10741 [Arctium lappa]
MEVALELLRCACAIQNDIQNLLSCERDIVQSCYCDSSRSFDPRRESDVPPDVTLEVILFESPNKNRWPWCLSELFKYGAEFCPRAVQEANAVDDLELGCLLSYTRCYSMGSYEYVVERREICNTCERMIDDKDIDRKKMKISQKQIGLLFPRSSYGLRTEILLVLMRIKCKDALCKKCACQDFGVENAGTAGIIYCNDKVRDAGNLLTRANFTLPGVDVDEYHVRYYKP